MIQEEIRKESTQDEKRKGGGTQEGKDKKKVG